MYFSRGGLCFLQRESDEEPIVHILQDCALLGDRQADAENGLRIYQRGLDGGTVIDPHNRTIASSMLGTPPGRRAVLEPPADAPGELIGVGSAPDGRLAQWAFGGRRYFVYHDREGAPLSESVEAEIRGELLGNDHNGLTLLRWEDDLPVEVIHARATIEWVRATP